MHRVTKHETPPMMSNAVIDGQTYDLTHVAIKYRDWEPDIIEFGRKPGVEIPFEVGATCVLEMLYGPDIYRYTGQWREDGSVQIQRLEKLWGVRDVPPDPAGDYRPPRPWHWPLNCE